MSSFYCRRCRTTWGYLPGNPIATFALWECIDRKCRPWWLRILIGRRWPNAAGRR